MARMSHILAVKVVRDKFGFSLTNAVTLINTAKEQGKAHFGTVTVKYDENRTDDQKYSVTDSSLPKSAYFYTFQVREERSGNWYTYYVKATSKWQAAIILGKYVYLNPEYQVRGFKSIFQDASYHTGYFS